MAFLQEQLFLRAKTSAVAASADRVGLVYDNAGWPSVNALGYSAADQPVHSHSGTIFFRAL
jgi:hypothetical protein